MGTIEVAVDGTIGHRFSHVRSFVLANLTSDKTLDAAFAWFKQRHRDASPSNDVWNIRSNWPVEKATLRSLMLRGDYQFAPLKQLYKTYNGKADRGFDFLGYHFKQMPTGNLIVSLAEMTIINFKNKLAALQERAANAPITTASKRTYRECRASMPATRLDNQSQLYEHDWQPSKRTDVPVGEIITKYINRWVGWVN